MAKTWWDALSYAEQQKYLKHHPKSKRKITAKPGVVARTAATLKDSTRNLPELPQLPRPDRATLSKVLDYAKANKGAIALALAPTLLGLNRRWDREVDNETAAKRQRTAAALRTAIALGDSRVRERVGQMFNVRTGVALVAITGIAVFTGIDMSLFLPWLATDFWKDVEQGTDATTYLKNMGAAYFASIGASLKRPEALADAAVARTGDVTVDDQRNEVASVSVSSPHETDLNKALVRLERVNVEQRTGELAQMGGSHSFRVQRLLDHTYLLEAGIPKIASILVAAVPQRLSLARRAKTQLAAYSGALTRTRGLLAELSAAETAAPLTPMAALLRKQLKPATLKSERAYLRCEDNQIRLCEVHHLTGVQVGERTLGPTEVFSYFHEGQLHVASVVDSNFLPKAFETISARRVRSWLQDTGLLE